MWKTLRSRLERWGWLDPAYDRVTLSGSVHTPNIDAEDGDGYRDILLSVKIAGASGGLYRLDANNRFRLELPLDHTITLTIVRQGHLPRMVEVRPLRSSLRFARAPVHATCELEVVLTPRFSPEGHSARPLLERITMPKERQPLIVEWDHVLRAEQREAFVPLFLRTA